MTELWKRWLRTVTTIRFRYAAVAALASALVLTGTALAGPLPPGSVFELTAFTAAASSSPGQADLFLTVAQTQPDGSDFNLNGVPSSTEFHAFPATIYIDLSAGASVTMVPAELIPTDAGTGITYTQTTTGPVSASAEYTLEIPSSLADSSSITAAIYSVTTQGDPYTFRMGPASDPSWSDDVVYGTTSFSPVIPTSPSQPPTSSGTESASTVLQSGTFSACSANFSTSQPSSCGGNSATAHADAAISASEGSYTLDGWGQVTDLTGLGDGWNVSETGNALTLTSVANAQENPAAVNHATLPTTIGASDPAMDPSAPTSEAVNDIIGSTVSLPSGGTVLSAPAGQGMGVYDFDETLTYRVPADAYAGTYSTTLTVEVTENPPPT